MKNITLILFFVMLVSVAACGGGSSIIPLPDDSGNPSPVVSPPVDSDKIALTDAQITSPLDGTTVGGMTTINTNVEAIQGFEGINFIADGKVIGTGKSFLRWDTTTVSNGWRHLYAEVFANGSRYEIPLIQVRVDNKIPIWDFGRELSSLPNISVDSVNPSSFPRDYEGWVEVHGSGFDNLLTEDVVWLGLYVSGVVGLVNQYTEPEILSDTVIRFYIWSDSLSIWDQYSLSIEVRHNSKIVIAALLHDAVSITDDGEGAYITLMEPNSSPVEREADLSLVLNGVRLPDANNYMISLYGCEPIVVGETGYNSIIMITEDVDFLSDSQMLVVFPLNTWRNQAEPGDYWLELSAEFSPGMYRREAVFFPFTIEGENPLVPPFAGIIVDPSSGDAPFEIDPIPFAHSNNPGGYIVSWQWDFDGNGTWDSMEENPIHVYEMPGNYLVKLRVEDNYGESALAENFLVEVTDGGPNYLPPLVTAHASPDSGPSPFVTVLSATASSQNGGVITQYRWDFDGNGTWDSYSASPSHTFYVPEGESQNISVLLQVTDSFGMSATDTVNVQVTSPSSNNFPPSIDAFTHSPVNPVYVIGGAGVDVTFYVQVSGESIDHYLWDFDGDGTWDKTTWSNPISTHYRDPNSVGLERDSWTVQVKVVDALGQSANAFRQVDVWASAKQDPRAFFFYNFTANPAFVNFEGSGNAYDGETIIGYAWDFDGDGVVDSTNPITSFTYDVPAGVTTTWEATLTVTDSLNRTGSFSRQISMYGPPLPQAETSIVPTSLSIESGLSGTFSLDYDGQPREINWYVDHLMKQSGGWQFTEVFNLEPGLTSRTHTVSVEVYSASGSKQIRYASVLVYRGSGNSGNSGDNSGDIEPDLPPIQIQGDTTGGVYDADNVQIGQGAPNESVRQAFIAANIRSRGDAGNATRPVYRWLNGYIQDLAGGAAGSGAFVMMDGQSKAAWIHGDIYTMWISLGGPGGYLGWPVKDEALGWTSWSGAQNSFSEFSGDGYAQAEIVFHKTGANQYKVCVVRGAIYNVWKQGNFARGPLGLPTSDMYLVNGDWRSDFEGGYLIYRSAANRVDKHLNGQSSGGDPPSGNTGIPSNIQTLFQQERDSLPSSMLGYPTSEITLHASGSNWYYQQFDGGTGGAGMLVYTTSEGRVFHVHGSIFTAWWGELFGVVGLPTSDEYTYGFGTRSDFEHGFIVWDSTHNNTAGFHNDGTPITNVSPELRFTPFQLADLYIEYFVVDYEILLDPDAVGSFEYNLELGSIAVVMAIGPEGKPLVKFIGSNFEKSVDAEKFLRRALTVEKFTAGYDSTRILAKALGAAGNPEYRMLLETFEQPKNLKYAEKLAQNSVLRGKFVRYISEGGRLRAEFIARMLQSVPDAPVQMTYNTSEILEEARQPLTEYLSTIGYSADSLGVAKFLDEAAVQGRIYFGLDLGTPKVFLYHEPAQLLVEISESRQVQHLIKTSNPDVMFAAPGLNPYSEMIQIRKWLWPGEIG